MKTVQLFARPVMAVTVLLLSNCVMGWPVAAAPLPKTASSSPTSSASSWTPAAQNVAPPATTATARGKITSAGKPMQGKVPDAQLQRTLRLRLLDDPVTRPFAAKAVVQNGQALLLGQTFSERAKEAAQKTAERVPGMVGVQNRIVVEPSVDLRIAQQLHKAYGDDPTTGHSNIAVTVLKGRVYLSGVVDSTEEQKRATDMALRIPGVAEVSNGLAVSTVARPAGRTVPIQGRTYSAYRSVR